MASAPPPYYGTQRSNTSNVPFSNPLSRIELKISCRKLLDLDVFSKSDPFCVLYMQSSNKSSWREIGRTEIIWNTLNPDFVKSFQLDYFFEEQQMLKFAVYDADCKSQDLSKHDFIGSLEVSLGSIVGEHGGRLQKLLKNDKCRSKSPGTLIVKTEEVSSCKDVIVLQLRGRKLDKMDFFGKSDPFLTFERSNEDGSFSVVHKTEVIKRTLNPQWKRFSVPSQTLCNGDSQRSIRVKCFDWELDGGHKLIGQFETSLDALTCYRDRNISNYMLVHPDKKRKKKSYKNSGTIEILFCDVIQKPSFLDFLRGGLELCFIVAVDFTASNGDPRTPQSLHFNSQYQPSQYVQALQAVGGVIEDYDTDKLFPAYGFGAKLPPYWNVSHEFPLNFNASNPDCEGINGVIAAYYQSINSVQLYGPTNFSPIINSAARIARQHARSGNISQYFILLIITDGIITDMERTKSAIVEAATLPMSIIIVGVGNADFEAMDELDGDEIRVSYNGREAERDIVQFVPFRDYMKNNQYDPMHGVRLAKDVLHELPDQLVEYMEKRNIKPNNPPPYSP